MEGEAVVRRIDGTHHWIPKVVQTKSAEFFSVADVSYARKERLRKSVAKTLALEHGASAHVVASSLGHESFSTTVESYARPEALEGARQKRVMTVLDGGRFASSI